MDLTFTLFVQAVIWIITLMTTGFLVWWTYNTRNRRQFWSITIPQLFYLANQLIFYASLLVARYYGLTMSELFGTSPGLSELWSSLLRLQGTITLLAMAFIVKSYLKRIPYDSIYLR
jgi:hypothetical protein